MSSTRSVAAVPHAAKQGLRLSHAVIERKERIQGKFVLQGLDMDGGDGKGRFATIGHMHSYTRAFGDPEERDGIWLRDHDVVARFELDEANSGSAYELKLIAAMERWNRLVTDIDILVNDRSLRSGKMLFENVATGWPANFLDIPPGVLRQGTNTVTIRNNSRHSGREALMINRIEVLVRPLDEDLQLERAPAILRVGEPALVRVRNAGGIPLALSASPGLAVRPLERDGLEEVFEVVASVLDNDQSITFRAGAVSLVYRPERVVHADGPYRMLVGTDLNDDRHDETTPGLIDFFDKTGLGNAIGFRMDRGRNCWSPPMAAEWASWFALLARRRMRFWMENGAFNNPEFIAAAPTTFVPFFAATKYHEFCHSLMDIADRFRDLGHATETFYEQLAFRRTRNGMAGTPFWVADASMHLCLLARSDQCDVPIAEPVTSDHMLLYASIKRAARIHGKPWGAHVAVQWYLGQGNTEDKLRRLRTTMHLAYMLGASIIYTESGIFKYVQHGHRWDKDHPITRSARDVLREVYAFTRTQQVVGEPQSSINVLYGNLDSAFFYPDEIPLDTGKSDGLRRLFYKWERTEEDFGWMAVKNLMRPLRQSGLKGYPGDQGINHWFSANPYGGVDVIPVADLLESPQKVSFLLGRNVMTEDVHQTLHTYVASGGILFLTAHQFNTETDPDRPKTFFRGGDFSELAGVALADGSVPLGRIATETNLVLTLPQAVYEPNSDGSELRLFRVRVSDGTILAKDAATGSPVLMAKRIGQGWTVTYVGETTIGNTRLKPFVDDVVNALAGIARASIHIADDAEVFLQEWRYRENDTDVSKIFLINIDWTTEMPNEVAELSIDGRRFDVRVPAGPPTVLYRAGSLCVSAASPWTQIWDIRADARSIRFMAMGRDLERFTCRTLSGCVGRVTANGVEIPRSTACGRDDITEFACELNTPKKIVVELI